MSDFWKNVGTSITNSAGSGLFGLGSNLLENMGAKSRQRQADRNNIKFWNMQNEYNTPANQMKRLKNAGLNPNLIYGSGSANTGIAGSIAPSKPAPYNVKNPVPLQSMLIDAQIGNIKADTAQKQEDTLRMQGETPGRKTSIEAKATIDSIKAEGYDTNKATMIQGIVAGAKTSISNADQAEFNKQIKKGEKEAQDNGFFKGQYMATFVQGILGLDIKDLDKPQYFNIPGVIEGTYTNRNAMIAIYGALQAGKLLINNLNPLKSFFTK